MKKSVFLMLIGLCFLVMPVRAQINLLHEFPGSTNDGEMPADSLILSGTTLYGMTNMGGASDYGVIFKVQTNGSGYTVLHEFAGGATDGSYPYGSLIIDGSTLYGMTNGGGADDCGTVFKVQTDGSGYTLLHEFGGSSDGHSPYGSLLLSGSTLYGMTTYGGQYTYGTIFKIETNGSGYILLHEFASSTTDGEEPDGSLIISGSTLYGMTKNGLGNYGTIFKLQTDGSAFTLLHKFAGNAADGGFPEGDLILSGSTLYGMTCVGGDSNLGTIFKIQTDGSGYTLLREFAGGAADGASPQGSLIFSGSTLYGMTPSGGDSDAGTIFKIKADGSGFALVHEFAGGTGDGDSPTGSLVLSGLTLYGMTVFGGDDNWGVVFSLPLLSSIILTAPNGGESWIVGSSHDITWSSSDTFEAVDIDYSIDSGSNWTPVASDTANDGSYSWTIPDTPSTTCLVRVSDAADSDLKDSSDARFTILAVPAETVSTPNQPGGPNSGLIATSYPFTTGGSTSSLGHPVQYKIDWDDGSDSGWLPVGTTQASHSWATAGTYDVRAMARCADHTAIESLWSTTLSVIISDLPTGHYNSPTQYKVLPEVIWATATGGGTWMSNVQVNDVTGGSIVSVYYNTGTTRRGPFQLWDNSGGGALSSFKYGNLLETIDQLDAGPFAYYGTVGSVEFITQDGAHKVQAAARTLNGYYAKTFTAVSLHDANTAATSRAMVVSNLTNNAGYRSTAGFFNPTADSVTVEFTLLDAGNNQVGTQFNRTLAGHEFQAFNPFNQAGVPYPGASFDNVILRVRPTSGLGKVVCFGATVDNMTNDPAAHVAVQGAAGFDNGPGSLQILPEAIWATATGGGTWVSEVQIVDATGGSVVSVYFDYGGGSRRGPFTLWTGGAAGTKMKYINLLETIDNLDSGVFDYYGKVGAVEFRTQDGAHAIQVTARTLNGNYSKTFPGLNLISAETADTTRVMLIQNYTNNVGYRSTSGFFNPTPDVVTVEFTLLNNSGAQIGSPFSKTLAGFDFQAFNPFIQAGVPYPANSYDNIILRIRPTSGGGLVMCFGASVDNTSNDPASHLAVQGE